MNHEAEYVILRPQNTNTMYNTLKPVLEQELAERQRLFGKESVTWPNLEQRAQGGNSEELYATVFWLFSEDTHMTVEGLNKFLRYIEGGIAMTTELDLSVLDQEIQTAYISYIAFINTCYERFGFPSEEELREFNNSEMLPKHD